MFLLRRFIRTIRGCFIAHENLLDIKEDLMLNRCMSFEISCFKARLSKLDVPG